MKLMKFLVVAVAAFLSSASPSLAQSGPYCDTRDSVIKQLSDKYREAPVALGVTHNGSLIEVLSTGDGKTWSIIITSPRGRSCLVAAGEGWREIEGVPQGPET